jgi:hypothetical protein
MSRCPLMAHSRHCTCLLSGVKQTVCKRPFRNPFGLTQLCKKAQRLGGLWVAY